MAVRAVVAGLSALLLSGCSSPATATGPHASATPSPSVILYTPPTTSGPSGDYTNSSGPIGYTNSSGANGYTGASGLYGFSGATAQNGCWYVSYGLCLSGATGGAPGPVRTDPGFACRIAVSNGQPGSGGFITLPGGGFAVDPGSDVSISAPPGSEYHPNNFGFTFTGGRWLPVRREWVSSDGTRYAYPDATGIHVISVADGADTVVGSGQAWQLLDLENTGAYAVASNHTIGLWFLPLTGSPRQITDRGYWITVRGAIAYGQLAPSVPSGVTNQVLRLDLASGAVQTWWSDPAPNVQLLAVAPDGSLLIAISNVNLPVVDVRRMPEPDHWIPVFSDPNWLPPRYLTLPVVVDSRGTWLSDTDGIWLSSPSGTLLVSNVSGQLASGCG